MPIDMHRLKEKAHADLAGYLDEFVATANTDIGVFVFDRATGSSFTINVRPQPEPEVRYG